MKRGNCLSVTPCFIVLVRKWVSQGRRPSQCSLPTSHSMLYCPLYTLVTENLRISTHTDCWQKEYSKRPTFSEVLWQLKNIEREEFMTSTSLDEFVSIQSTWKSEIQQQFLKFKREESVSQRYLKSAYICWLSPWLTLVTIYVVLGLTVCSLALVLPLCPMITMKDAERYRNSCNKSKCRVVHDIVNPYMYIVHVDIQLPEEWGLIYMSWLLPFAPITADANVYMYMYICVLTKMFEGSL